MVKTPSEFGNGFGRNDAMAEAGRCLADGGVLESFRASDISKNYRQREREELMRETETVEFVNHTASDLQDQGLRGQSPTYICSIYRISQNEFYEQRISN